MKFLYFALSTSCICTYFGGAVPKIQIQYLEEKPIREVAQDVGLGFGMESSGRAL